MVPWRKNKIDPLPLFGQGSIDIFALVRGEFLARAAIRFCLSHLDEEFGAARSRQQMDFYVKKPQVMQLIDQHEKRHGSEIVGVSVDVTRAVRLFRGIAKDRSGIASDEHQLAERRLCPCNLSVRADCGGGPPGSAFNGIRASRSAAPNKPR